MQPHAITAADGYVLAARAYGDPRHARAGVLIAAAMGVEQTYYADFAHWLAQRGLYVLSFDYRGVGHSRRARSLRGLEADIRTWAERDAGAALAWLREQLPGRPVAWVGHSLGGQILGMVPDHESVAAVLTVTAASGYVGDNAPALRRRVWLFWDVAVPLATALFGYFPGRRLRMVGDLPAGVIKQWRRWCRSPDYLFGAEPELKAPYAACQWPLLALAVSDDELLTLDGWRKLHSHYSGACLSAEVLTPTDGQADRIGHFGYFRRRFADTLWPRAAQWLDAQLLQGSS